MPDGWRPEVPESAKTPSPAELAASVQNELVALRHEITSLRDTQQAETEAPSRPWKPRRPPSRTRPRGPNRLRSITGRGCTTSCIARPRCKSTPSRPRPKATRPRSPRSRDASAVSPPARSERCRRPTSIDTAVKLGQELADWYENGANLYDKAVQVWESPARGQAGDQLTQDWETDTGPAPKRRPVDDGPGDGRPRFAHASLWRGFCAAAETVRLHKKSDKTSLGGSF